MVTQSVTAGAPTQSVGTRAGVYWCRRSASAPSAEMLCNENQAGDAERHKQHAHAERGHERPGMLVPTLRVENQPVTLCVPTHVPSRSVGTR